MISVEEAQETILSKIRPLGREKVQILEALGRVLAEDIHSPRSIPPWANSAMDGFAVRAEDVKSATRDRPITLRIVEEIQAGFTARRAIGRGETIRIMTGAPIPEGADAVVLVEETERAGEAEVHVHLAAPLGEAIRIAGEDVKKGERVLQTNDRLTSAAVGMLANLGRAFVHVYQKPRVAILATGEELVDLDQELGIGQIYNSNSYAIASQVAEAGGVPVRLGIARDNAEDLERHFRDGLNADLIVSSGGVSIGEFDLVKDALGGLGNEMHFWRVRMKPGKPLAFGTIQGIPVFGLPGNPVSTMVCFELFVRPSLLKMQGRTRMFRSVVETTLLHPLRKTPERRHYVRAVISHDNGSWTARAVEAQGSHIIHSMVRANALLVFPENKTDLPAGSQVEAILLEEDSPLGAAPLRGSGAETLVSTTTDMPGKC